MTNFITKLKTSIAIGTLVAGTLIGAAGANASITYNYTGRALEASTINTLFDGKIISGHVTISHLATETALITGSMIDFTTLIAGTDYTFEFHTDPAVFILDESNVTLFNSFSLTTIAGGSISDWLIDITNEPAGCAGMGTTECQFFLSSLDDNESAVMLSPNLVIAEKTLDRVGHVYWTDSVHPAPTPEVTGLILGGLGLMGFAALRRK